ncbi:hypothetical protein KSP40_PGU003901 [Platanthera guangdongensis]|uniref:Uncharacterized protein n=1 Tax=Platanthera guangdongensis TaxID=2320717 RepID=A0ABR2LWH6_9ASPA
MAVLVVEIAPFVEIDLLEPLHNEVVNDGSWEIAESSEVSKKSNGIQRRFLREKNGEWNNVDGYSCEMAGLDENRRFASRRWI